MDAAGVALGVTGLLALYSTCLAAYEFILNVVDHKKNAATLICKLTVEKTKFGIWGLHWGLTDQKGVHYNAAAASEELQSEIRRQFLQGVLARVRALLTDVDELVQRHGLDNKSIKDDEQRDALKALQSLAGQVDKHPAEVRKQLHAKKRFRWAIRDQTKFEKFLQDLLYFNDALYQVLPLKQRQSLEFAVSGAVLDREEGQDALREIHQSASESSKVLAEAAQLKELSIRLEGASTSDFSTIRQRSSLQIPSSLLDVLDAPRANRKATYTRPDGEETQVLVEWRRTEADWSQETRDLMFKRFENISRLLHACSMSRTSLSYRILDSAGFVEDTSAGCIGFLNQLPPDASGFDTLSQRLASPSRPDLGTRFALARILVVAIYQIHSSGWLHKALRSNNVIFLAESLLSPYLIGFGRSRPDKHNENTEEVPDLPGAAFDLYLPPIYQRGQRFSQGFDIYSLGIVLIEIAVWESIETMKKPKDTCQRYHDRLRRRAEGLGDEVGIIYRDVDLKCLDLGRINTDQAQGLRESLTKGNEWVYWNVAAPLERCMA